MVDVLHRVSLRIVTMPIQGYPDYGCPPVDYLVDDPELELRSAHSVLAASARDAAARARTTARSRRLSGLPERTP